MSACLNQGYAASQGYLAGLQCRQIRWPEGREKELWRARISRYLASHMIQIPTAYLVLYSSTLCVISSIAFIGSDIKPVDPNTIVSVITVSSVICMRQTQYARSLVKALGSGIYLKRNVVLIGIGSSKPRIFKSPKSDTNYQPYTVQPVHSLTQFPEPTISHFIKAWI